MILVWLILVPFIGGLLCWLSERFFGRSAPRWIALASMSLLLGLGLMLWLQGDYSLHTAFAGTEPQWQAEYQASWIPRFGISFHLGLDGLSLLMCILTGLLGVMAVACSWSEIQRNVGFFHLNLLWNLGGVIGVFLALDLFLFFFFWEMMLVPMYFLIALWGHNAPDGKGRIYAANSLGAIVGVLFAIHIGLPRTGLGLTLATGAMLDLALGLVLLGLAGAAPTWRLAAVATLAVPLLVVRLVPLDPSLLSSGVYRTGNVQNADKQTVFYQDGKTATISVARYGGSQAALATNGKPDAAIQFDTSMAPAPDEITMVMLGALPLALHPEARTIANIGFGSGLTTHVLLGSPTVKSVSTIEIEPAVVEASRAFATRVGRAYDDPRSHIHLEDAKSWFARGGKRFDIIVSEPSNPWVSGVSSLFSDEFYHRIRNYLEDGGLLVQWLHLYEFDAQLVASVVKALDRNFADYAIYDIDGLDIVIVASRDRKLPPPGGAVFSMPQLRGELARVGLRSADDLRVRWIGAKADLGPMMQAFSAPVNSDYRPYVELNAPRSRFLGSQALELPGLLKSRVPLVEMLAPAGMQWSADAVTPGKGRADFISVASAIRAALLGQAGPPGSARDEALKDLALVSGCGALETTEARRALHGLASATLAFLDRKALEGLWVEPDWLRCPRDRLPATVTRWLDLYRAVALRDPVAMRTTGRVALADADADVERRRWALLATMLALRAQGDAAGVQALWREQQPKLHDQGTVGPDMAFLLVPR